VWHPYELSQTIITLVQMESDFAKEVAMLRRSLLSLLTCSLVLACSDATGADRGVVGTWRLQTVDGQLLPFILTQNEVDKLELTGEAMTLLASGRFTMVTTFRVTDGSNVFLESIPDEGTYAVNGSTVTFTFNTDGSTVTATVDGTAMTLNDIGLTFVYRRK
jgi:hypothetical protein